MINQLALWMNLLFISFNLFKAIAEAFFGVGTMLGASVGGKNILKHNKKNWNYKIIKRLVEKKVLIFPINNQIVMKVCSTISLGFLSPSTCAGGSCCARRASRSAALTIRDHFKWRRRKNRVTEISVSGIDLPPPLIELRKMAKMSPSQTYPLWYSAPSFDLWSLDRYHGQC